MLYNIASMNKTAVSVRRSAKIVFDSSCSVIQDDNKQYAHLEKLRLPAESLFNNQMNERQTQ